MINAFKEKNFTLVLRPLIYLFFFKSQEGKIKNIEKY